MTLRALMTALLRHGWTSVTNRIVIIGGGPVGLALSVALARYGVPSLVVERRLAPTSIDESRAIIWMPKGIEFLEWIGLLDEFTGCAVVRNIHRFRIHGRKLLDLRLGVARSRYGYSLNLPQHFTEAIFEAEGAKHPHLIEFKRGYEMRAICDDGTGVAVVIENPNTQKTEEVRGAFLIGCDGAKSRVRDLAGIGLNWSDYGTMSAVADLETRLPDDPSISWIELNSRRPTGLFNFHPNKWRIIYRVNKGETREDAASPDFVRKIIAENFSFIKDYRLLWASCFRLGQGQSDRYYLGRVVLAGDAAHPMGPSAGAGMMVGMLGVWRLAFRLRAILNETDPDAISSYLSDYERAQMRGSTSIQRSNAATFYQIAVTRTVLGILRNLLLKALSFIPFIPRAMVAADTLTDQVVDYEDFPRTPDIR